MAAVCSPEVVTDGLPCRGLLVMPICACICTVFHRMSVVPILAKVQFGLALPDILHLSLYAPRPEIVYAHLVRYSRPVAGYLRCQPSVSLSLKFTVASNKQLNCRGKLRNQLTEKEKAVRSTSTKCFGIVSML